jgi:hypothetical protein
MVPSRWHNQWPKAHRGLKPLPPNPFSSQDSATLRHHSINQTGHIPTLLDQNQPMKPIKMSARETSKYATTPTANPDSADWPTSTNAIANVPSRQYLEPLLV